MKPIGCRGSNEKAPKMLSNNDHRTLEAFSFNYI